MSAVGMAACPVPPPSAATCLACEVPVSPAGPAERDRAPLDVAEATGTAVVVWPAGWPGARAATLSWLAVPASSGAGTVTGLAAAAGAAAFASASFAPALTGSGAASAAWTGAEAGPFAVSAPAAAVSPVATAAVRAVFATKSPTVPANGAGPPDGANPCVANPCVANPGAANPGAAKLGDIKPWAAETRARTSGAGTKSPGAIGASATVGPGADAAVCAPRNMSPNASPVSVVDAAGVVLLKPLAPSTGEITRSAGNAFSPGTGFSRGTPRNLRAK